MSYLEQRTEFLQTLRENEATSEERVNITINEYLHMFDEYFRMKAEVDRLEGVLRNMNALSTKLGIPVEVIEKIDSSSVSIDRSFDVMEMTDQYVVRFRTPADIIGL